MSIIYQFFISFIWIFPDRIFMCSFLHGIRKLDGKIKNKLYYGNKKIYRRSFTVRA